MNWTWNVRAFSRDEKGQDLIEYALLVGLISLVAVLALTAVGTNVTAIFDSIKTSLANAA